MKNFNEFIETIEAKLEAQVTESVDISIREITKNNNITLTALNIRPEGSDIAPCIYMENYYEEYTQGRKIQSIVDELAEIYQKTKGCKSWDAKWFLDWEQVKERIFVKLINTKANEKLLEDVPYVPFLDLSATFYIDLSHNTADHMTALIKTSQLQYWGIGTEELYEIALSNSRKNVTFQSMFFMLRQTLMEEEYGGLLDFPADDELGSDMYILGNTSKHLGASSILHTDILANIAEDLACSYYIIPSSIHETIIVPDNAKFNNSDIKETDLSNMVAEVNSSEVSIEEQLSDHVYYYDIDKKQVTMK